VQLGSPGGLDKERKFLYNKEHCATIFIPWTHSINLARGREREQWHVTSKTQKLKPAIRMHKKNLVGHIKTNSYLYKNYMNKL
jgi:hypothetical protein